MIGDAHGDGAILFQAGPFVGGCVFQFAGSVAHGESSVEVQENKMGWNRHILTGRMGKTIDAAQAA
ncbi:MAG: hypothetical protein Hals2KO_34810 [Halioglobus sp.]